MWETEAKPCFPEFLSLQSPGFARECVGCFGVVCLESRREGTFSLCTWEEVKSAPSSDLLSQTGLPVSPAGSLFPHWAQACFYFCDGGRGLLQDVTWQTGLRTLRLTWPQFSLWAPLTLTLLAPSLTSPSTSRSSSLPGCLPS